MLLTSLRSGERVRITRYGPDGSASAMNDATFQRLSKNQTGTFVYDSGHKEIILLTEEISGWVTIQKLEHEAKT